MKIAYTISTVNHLCLAKTAADSFLTYNHDHEFIIFLFDKINSQFDVEEFFPLKIVEVESLQLSSFNEMVEKYSAFEMCNALKPFIAEHILLNTADVKQLIYIDSDLMFYSAIEAVETALLEHNIIFTPHLIHPMGLDGYIPNERNFLQAGIYNGGFFALKPSIETLTFLTWWKKRLELYCYVKLDDGLFVDQVWINFVPLYFESAHILKQPGYNIGHWNLHERLIENRDEKYWVNSTKSLVFFHFSGYDVTQPTEISKHQNRFSFDQRNDVKALFEEYRDVVTRNNSSQLSNIQCYYSTNKKAGNVTPKNINTFKRKVKTKLRSILHLND